MPESEPGPADPARHAVLITRPAAAADRTAARVHALGLTPVLAPLMALRPGRIAWPPGVDAVLATSGNAAAALAGAAAVPVLAVGDGTADRLREAGLARVESAGGDAAALLALATARLPRGSRLLLASGAGQGVALAAELRRAGFVVRRRVAYRMVPVPSLPDVAVAAIEGGGLRAVLFLSAETARIFVRRLPPGLLPHLAGIEALAIAPAAAEVLAPLPWRRVRVSVGPTLDQVLALL